MAPRRLDLLALSAQRHTLLAARELDAYSKNPSLIGLKGGLSYALFTKSPIDDVVAAAGWSRWVVLILTVISMFYGSKDILESYKSSKVARFEHYRFTNLERRDGNPPTAPGIEEFGLMLHGEGIEGGISTMNLGAVKPCKTRASEQGVFVEDGASMILTLPAWGGPYEGPYHLWFIRTLDEPGTEGMDPVRFTLEGSHDMITWTQVGSSDHIHLMQKMLYTNGTAYTPTERGALLVLDPSMVLAIDPLLNIGFLFFLSVSVVLLMAISGRKVRRSILAVLWLQAVCRVLCACAILAIDVREGYLYHHRHSGYFNHLLVTGLSFGVAILWIQNIEEVYELMMLFLGGVNVISLVTLYHNLYRSAYGRPLHPNEVASALGGGTVWVFLGAITAFLRGTVVLRAIKGVEQGKAAYVEVFQRVAAEQETDLQRLHLAVDEIRMLSITKEARQLVRDTTLPHQLSQPSVAQGNGSTVVTMDWFMPSHRGAWGYLAHNVLQSEILHETMLRYSQQAADRVSIPVQTLDQLHAQAFLVHEMFLDVVVRLGKEHKGYFRLKNPEATEADFPFTSWHGGPVSKGRLQLGGIKSVQSCVAKLNVAHGGDVTRLLDVCRETLYFKRVKHVVACLKAIAGDSELEIVRIKNTMAAATDPACDERGPGVLSAGMKFVSIGVRLVGNEMARSLCVDTHVCELLLVLTDIGGVQTQEMRDSYKEWRKCKRVLQTLCITESWFKRRLSWMPSFPSKTKVSSRIAPMSVGNDVLVPENGEKMAKSSSGGDWGVMCRSAETDPGSLLGAGSPDETSVGLREGIIENPPQRISSRSPSQSLESVREKDALARMPPLLSLNEVARDCSQLSDRSDLLQNGAPTLEPSGSVKPYADEGRSLAKGLESTSSDIMTVKSTPKPSSDTKPSSDILSSQSTSAMLGQQAMSRERPFPKSKSLSERSTSRTQLLHPDTSSAGQLPVSNALGRQGQKSNRGSEDADSVPSFLPPGHKTMQLKGVARSAKSWSARSGTSGGSELQVMAPIEEHGGSMEEECGTSDRADMQKVMSWLNGGAAEDRDYEWDGGETSWGLAVSGQMEELLEGLCRMSALGISDFLDRRFDAVRNGRDLSFNTLSLGAAIYTSQLDLVQRRPVQLFLIVVASFLFLSCGQAKTAYEASKGFAFRPFQHYRLETILTRDGSERSAISGPGLSGFGVLGLSKCMPECDPSGLDSEYQPTISTYGRSIVASYTERVGMTGWFVKMGATEGSQGQDPAFFNVWATNGPLVLDNVTCASEDGEGRWWEEAGVHTQVWCGATWFKVGASSWSYTEDAGDVGGPEPTFWDFVQMPVALPTERGQDGFQSFVLEPSWYEFHLFFVMADIFAGSALAGEAIVGFLSRVLPHRHRNCLPLPNHVLFGFLSLSASSVMLQALVLAVHRVYAMAIFSFLNASNIFLLTTAISLKNSVTSKPLFLIFSWCYAILEMVRMATLSYYWFHNPFAKQSVQGHAVLTFCVISTVLRFVGIKSSGRILRHNRSRYDSLWDELCSTDKGKESVEKLDRAVESMISRDFNGPCRQYNRLRAAAARSSSEAEDASNGGAPIHPLFQSLGLFTIPGAMDTTSRVRSCNQLFCQAAIANLLLIDRLKEWAELSQGFFCDGFVEGHSLSSFVKWNDLKGGVDAERRVKWTPMKRHARCIEKMLRSYDNDPSRLLDISRGSIAFETLADLSACLDAIWADEDVVVSLVKNRMSASFDASETGGYRDVSIKLRLVSPQARALGAELHVCEVQLLMKCFASLRSENDIRYARARDTRGS